ncbi:MAG: hypothetical protein UU77_C0003G0001, partial [candidate division WWE3 bacterium GW2011_GWC1_41_7]
LAGILLTVVNYQEYLAQARDARRISEIMSIQTAISSAVADNVIRLTDTGSCTTCDSVTGTTAVDGTGWIKFENNSGRGLKDTIPILPEDPSNRDEYRFEYYSDGIRFEINARFESEKYFINSAKDGGNDDEVYERGWDLELH